MVGTLVLSLPSAHTGGELVIGHAGQSRTCRASKTGLSLVAFYADCPHEVTPVRSGYRVTLTFNLLAERGAPERESGPLDDVAHCLEQHFNAPARSNTSTHRPGRATAARTSIRPAVLSTCSITSTPSGVSAGTGSRAPTRSVPRPPRRGARRYSPSPR
ncbi:2OG-Fe(II) oxygenase [Streptomyces dysideae]|uniref:2OG-Fe(II) oxygenase n=1 Tax=Streptomyces dysideae TaxID=909626 RepID=UPI0018FE0D4E|nr:2OG-Fe(II) oxygenase [Streptomyces dysideae]